MTAGVAAAKLFEMGNVCTEDLSNLVSIERWSY